MVGQGFQPVVHDKLVDHEDIAGGHWPHIISEVSMW